MTLVDPTYPPPTPGLIAGYAILATVSLLCAARAFQLGSTRSHYGHIYSVRFLFPLSAIIVALENATLASSGRFYQTAASSPDGTMTSSQQRYLYFVFACVALVVPILLLTTFELTYLVHKRRSVNFCGMFFDEGQRIRRMITTPMISFVLRNFIRIIAIILTAMGIIVNFDLVADTGRVDEDGTSRVDPRCGWVCLFQDERSWDKKTHILLSLIPTGVLILCNAYFSFLLWRYGTEFSMVVHASILNPWFSLSFGNAALAATQIFGYPPIWACTSNLGLIIFIVSILLLMVEVDKDMVAADEFADFLGQVSKMGDKLSAVPKKRGCGSPAGGGGGADGQGKGEKSPEGNIGGVGGSHSLQNPAMVMNMPLPPADVASAEAIEGDSIGTGGGSVPRTIEAKTPDIEMGQSTSIDDDEVAHRYSGEIGSNPKISEAGVSEEPEHNAAPFGNEEVPTEASKA